jgi:diguanylate cyclase (GGDEF)-like protein
LEEILGNLYTIVETTDGEQTLRLLEEQPDIVLLLLHYDLPRPGSLAVLEKLQQTGRLEQLPVIMILPDGDPDKMEQCFAAGATDYLQRPFDIPIVRKRVENTILLYTKTEKLMQLIRESKNENGDKTYCPPVRQLLDCFASRRERYKPYTSETSGRLLRRMEQERQQQDSLAAMTGEIQFAYTDDPPMLTMSGRSARQLGVSEVIYDPLHDQQLEQQIGAETLSRLRELVHQATREHPDIKQDCQFSCGGRNCWYRVMIRRVWPEEDCGLSGGFIGKAVDINDSQMLLASLRSQVIHDPLTKLLNVDGAREMIPQRMQRQQRENFTLVLFDLDHFKIANDTYGHLFGNRVLQYVADTLRQSTRSEDVLARIGGDEFLLFLDGGSEIEPVVRRLFQTLNGAYENFTISISMGIAQTEVIGYDYDDLLHAADQALYAVKRTGRGRYQFYDDSMKGMLSVLSPIDHEEGMFSQQA